MKIQRGDGITITVKGMIKFWFVVWVLLLLTAIGLWVAGIWLESWKAGVTGVIAFVLAAVAFFAGGAGLDEYDYFRNAKSET